MRKLLLSLALVLYSATTLGQTAPVAVPNGQMLCSQGTYPNTSFTRIQCTFPTDLGNYTSSNHASDLKGALLVPNLNTLPPGKKLKLRAHFKGFNGDQTDCDGTDAANSDYIVTRNCYSYYPNINLYSPWFTSWGGAWNGDLDFGWRIGALFNYARTNYLNEVDWWGGIQLEGTSEGGTSSVLQSFMLPDPYWQQRVTTVFAQVPNLLFMKDTAATAPNLNIVGMYWRNTAVQAAWGNTVGQPAKFDWHLGNILEQTNKIKHIYYRVNGAVNDDLGHFDLNFFRDVCDTAKVACFGTWHNAGHQAAEPGTNLPWYSLFSGPDSDARLDKMLPVFTKSSGNSDPTAVRGHYNLGLEWHSNHQYYLDSANLVVQPIRYRHQVNLGNGIPDQPTNITVDVTLRRVRNFALPAGRVVRWTLGAHANQAQQTGTVTVTNAGEVTIPNLKMDSLSAYGTQYVALVLQPVQPWKLVYSRTPHLKNSLAGYPADVEVANFQHATDVAKINDGFTEVNVVLDDLAGPDLVVGTADDGTSGNTYTVFDCWNSGYNCAAQEAKVSPNGQKIVYSVSFAMPGGPGQSGAYGGLTHELNHIVCAQIYVYDLLTGANTAVPNHPGGNCTANDGQQRAIDRQPAWLDNETIVFVSNRAGKYPHRATGTSEHLLRCQNYPACVSQTPYDVDGYGQANKSMQLHKMKITDGVATNIGPHDLNALTPEVLTNGDIIYSCYQAHADKGTSPGNASQIALPNLYWLCSVDSNGADMTVKFHGHKHSKMKAGSYLPTYPTINGLVTGSAPGAKGGLQGTDEIRGVRVGAEVFKGKVAVSTYYRANHLGSNGAIYGFTYGARMVEGCRTEFGCMSQSADSDGVLSTYPGSAQFVPSSITSITPWGQSADNDVGFMYLGEGVPYRSFGKAGYAAAWDANNFLITHSLGQSYIGVGAAQMAKSYLGETTSARKRILKVNAPGGVLPVTMNPFDTSKLVPMVDVPDYNVYDAKPIKTYQELYGQAAPTLKPALDASKGCFLQIVNARESELFEQQDQYPQQVSTRRCAHQGCAVQPQNENPNYIRNNMVYFNVRIPELFDFYYRGFNEQYKMTMNTIGYKNIYEYQRVKIQPDGSVKMQVPCDTPLLMSGQNLNGENIAVDDVMHSLRPGETRTCFGCHDGHSEERYAQLISGPQKTPQALFALKTAAAIVPPALSVKKATPKFATIGPIISARCGACHNSGNGETGFELDSLSMLYSRIVWDVTQEDFTWLPITPASPGVGSNALWRPLTSRFVSKFALESPLYWYVANKRLDGRTNAARNWDIDYVATHPNSGVTPAERALIRDWLDSGAPYQ